MDIRYNKLQHYGYRKAQPISFFFVMRGEDAQLLAKFLASSANVLHDNHVMYILDDKIGIFWSDHTLYWCTEWRINK
jgi:hypothetical protein